MKNQWLRPQGWLGRLLLKSMNKRHSLMSDWGLSHVPIPRDGAILDVGCGGGTTIAKLALASGSGTVHGLDHSADSVRVASATNAELIQSGRVAIWQGSVSQLPFASGTFDLVTTVETHFFWPNLHEDVRDVWRVIKPGGSFAIIADRYRGAKTVMSRVAERYAHRFGMALLTPDEHRDLLAGVGFEDIRVFTDASRGWICAIGRKSLPAS
jgi:ubiquinone/menaquinone biosynthesis C-methylase UbiE